MDATTQGGTWPLGPGEMATRLRAHDWGATSLGSPEAWPEELKAVVSLMLASSLVTSVAIGPERVLLYNDAAARLYGDRHPGALGCPLPETWPEAYASVAPLYERAFAGEAVAVPAQPLDLTREGGEVFEVYLTPVRDRAGAVLAVHMTGFEVGARLRAELLLRTSQERQAFLLKLGDALRAEPDADAVAHRAIAMLCDHLALDRCYVASFRMDEDRALITHQVGGERVAPMPPAICLSDFPAALRINVNGTLVIEDVAGAPGLSETDRRSMGALGFGALVAATLRRGEGNPLWTVVAVSAIPRRWMPGEVALAEEVAERTWAAMERARTEASLRESEARFRALFDTMGEGFAICSIVRGRDGRTIDLRYAELNRALERLTGLNREHLIGRTLSDLLPSADLERWLPLYAQATDRGEPVTFEQYTELLDRWYEVSAYPQGRDRLSVFYRDATERKRAEEVLRESEERLRAIVETATDYAIFTTDAEGRIETWPKGAQAVFGWTEEEAVGQLMDITFTPEDRAAGTPGQERREARETGHAPDVRWHLRKDGMRVFIEGMTRPLRGPVGAVTGFVKVGQDVTERRAAEAAMRDSEMRFRTLTEGMPQLVWRAVDRGYWSWASPQWTAFTGQPEAASHGWGWLEPVHPDDRVGAREAWERSKATGHFEAEYRLLEAATGEWRWFQTRATPVRNENGEVIEWLGTSTDVQDLREMQERQGVLVAELQHRTRNLLAVVRGVMDKTRRQSADLAAFVPAFDDRLKALGRVQGLLSRLSGNGRIGFDELLRTELAAVGAADAQGRGERVTLAGPQGVRLPSSTVQTFALALHELATNAVKYGALAQASGHLAVRWRLQRENGEPRLHVSWTETGVALPDPGARPQGGGYGRELIERALPYQLGAETTYELASDGVRCTIVLPVSSTMERDDA